MTVAQILCLRLERLISALKKDSYGAVMPYLIFSSPLGFQDHFILQLCLAQNVAQIIIGFEALAPPESACKEEVETRRMPTCSEAENKLLRRLWKQSCELTGRSPIDIPENFGHQVRIEKKFKRNDLIKQLS